MTSFSPRCEWICESYFFLLKPSQAFSVTAIEASPTCCHLTVQDDVLYIVLDFVRRIGGRRFRTVPKHVDVILDLVQGNPRLLALALVCMSGGDGNQNIVDGGLCDSSFSSVSLSFKLWVYVGGNLCQVRIVAKVGKRTESSFRKIREVGIKAPAIIPRWQPLFLGTLPSCSVLRNSAGITPEWEQQTRAMKKGQRAKGRRIGSASLTFPLCRLLLVAGWLDNLGAAGHCESSFTFYDLVISSCHVRNSRTQAKRKRKVVDEHTAECLKACRPSLRYLLSLVALPSRSRNLEDFIRIDCSHATDTSCAVFVIQITRVRI